MLRLSRYLSKYLAYLLIGVLILFGEATLNLALPNMMSNIVNVGIQQGGIEEKAPEIIPPDVYSLLTMFMTEEEFSAVGSSYTRFSELDAKTRSDISRTYPEASKIDALVYTGGKENQAETDTAFSKADYALYELLRTMAEQSGTNIAQASGSAADFDYTLLQQMVPAVAQVPQAMFDQAVEKGRETPEMMTGSVAAVLNKAFYAYLGADTGWIQTRYLLATGAIMLLLSAAQMLCAITAAFCFSRMGAGVARDLRRDIYAKVSGFSNAQMDTFSTSSLITRTTNDVTQVQMMYSMALRMLIFSPLMAIGGVLMAVGKSTAMSWIIVLGVILIFCVIGVLFVVALPKFKRMQKLVDRLSLIARENLTGLMVIRAFGTQKFQEDRFDEANNNLTKNSLFTGRAFATMMPVMMLIMNGISLLIIWVGAEQIAASTMQVGDMMAFTQYAMQIIMSFLFIAMIFVMVPRASVSAGRINEVLTSENLIADPKNPKTFDGRARGLVEFKNVNFRYAGADENALDDITFTAKPGETTAIIGATGAGKTTLVNLLPRFYDVSDGAVTLDGIDVRELTQHELRANIGYVPQRGLLFSGDISSNLRYGDPEASDQTLRKAAEVAQATEFIDALEDGFATEISQGGTNVSGGQRQRLAIARALVKKAPVYIFDDSFSALDFATDARLRGALVPYTLESAVIVVAQRVASIMHAQQILVMEEGRIVGRGTHKELLQSCPTYREIAESQLSKEELA